MEESNNYGHQHPLLLLNENRLRSIKRVAAYCSRCEEKVSAPCFGCAEEGCSFYLHKVCAEAPSELDHPFHRHHPLLMKHSSSHSYECMFCDERGWGHFYHCSCGLVFHIKCALFTFNIAQNNLKELEHVALVVPYIVTRNVGVFKCFGCREPLEKYTYFSSACGFNLHKKCAELSLKMNHKCHRKHPLLLQFTAQFTCVICGIGQQRGLGYGCSPCGLFIHIGCLSLSRNIEDKSHKHPFTLFWRQGPFICDACGTSGNYVAYTCGTCDIIVHKKCISLPRIIKSKWHDHRLSHTYFLHREYVEILDCVICHQEVNAEHGNYACSKCNDIFHVNCVTKDEASYVIVENEDEEEEYASSLIVLERNDAGEAIVVKHFKHDHPLRLGDRVSEHENKCCDGCLLPISASFYYCSQCEFYLHKVCAELPKVKHVWYHHCQQPLALTSNEVFRCVKCRHVCNGFAYKCEECNGYTCLRCVLALTPGARTCLGHKHNPLLFYTNYGGKCNACGDEVEGLFRCKACNISLDHRCFSLPLTAQHKCDDHLLSLTDHDDNSYSESHFCDICEEIRDLNLWFYHCARCDTSAHIKCVLGKYPFLKLGSIIVEKQDIHEHHLTIVKKTCYYPDCIVCGKPCVDLALECTKSVCSSYTFAHIDCVFGKYMFVKPGDILKIEEHMHPVTAVKRNYFYPYCRECRITCVNYFLECTDSGCNYIRHVNCPFKRF
ncbi:hypothetical protein GQ457_13G028310 [Hibiscus cannabinus]